MIPTPQQHRTQATARLPLAHFARFALIALAICAAVPALMAFEAWEIDVMRVLAP